MKRLRRIHVIALFAVLFVAVAAWRVHSLQSPKHLTIADVAEVLPQCRAVPAGENSPGVYLTTTSLSKDELLCLTYGRWNRWSGTVHVSGEYGVKVPESDHCLRLHGVILWGDPDLIAEAASKLR